MLGLGGCSCTFPSMGCKQLAGQNGNFNSAAHKFPGVPEGNSIRWGAHPSPFVSTTGRFVGSGWKICSIFYSKFNNHVANIRRKTKTPKLLNKHTSN